MSKIIFNGVDYAGGSGNYFNPIIDSDVERKVGVWRDNKPLYKKTYHFNSTVWINANGWTNGINVDTTDVETLVDAEVLRTIGAYSFYGYLQVVPYNNLLNIFNCRNTNMEIDTITLYYTKISDVAGSGDYNTYGVPTVHYDGNEQVIGTYFGKPLYQKTWVVPKSSLNSGETTYTHNNDLHIDNLVSVEGAVANSRPLVEYHSNSIWACSIYNIGNNAFWIYLGSSVYSNLANTSTVKVTLRYTKTTD